MLAVFSSALCLPEVLFGKADNLAYNSLKRMPVLSYKEYLDILKGPPKKKRVYKTALTTLFVVSLLLIGALSAMIFYYKKNIEPQILASNYLESASVGFMSSKQSLNDVLETFQVAGAKVATVDNLQNSPNPQEAYFIDLADKQKLLSKIGLAKQNVQFQKQQLQKTRVLPDLQNITNDLVGYYNQSEAAFNQTEKDHEFFKSVLIALGPDFYLPVLTKDSVWADGDINKIKNYYADKKLKAQDALANLSRLSPEDDFKGYYTAELSYLELFVKVSTDITNTLNSKSEIKPDSATEVERAYQQLINAQKENIAISSNLLAQKKHLLELKENLNRFAAVRYRANSLETRLKDENSKYAGNKSLAPKLEKMLQTYFHAT